MRRVAVFMLVIMVLSILLLLRQVAIRVVTPIADIAESFKNFQLNLITPGWRMARPKSLKPIADLAQWFNTFLEHMERRQESEVHLRIAATAFESQEGMLVLDKKACILRVNRAMQDLMGYGAHELIGRSADLFGAERHDPDFFQKIRRVVEQAGSWSGEVWNRRRNGSEFPSWVTITSVRNEDHELTHFVSTYTDITERKATEEEIRLLAFFDPLTRLPNRRLLNDRLRLAMLDCPRRQQSLALMLLDLDKFKTLNDTLGHDFGDSLLCQVGDRLVQNVREVDTVARLGGDEFVVLIQGLNASPLAAAAQAEVIAQKIQAALHEDYGNLIGSNYHSTVSMGITLYGDVGCSLEELMKQADIALYQAKEAGRSTLRFFEPAMQARLIARTEMEQLMREGLANDEFIIYLQPKVDVSRRVVGAEALVRWWHPTRGLIQPQAFIPLAEETGLIIPLGQLVLRKACEQLVAWADRRQLCIAVNVSPRQFRQADFVPSVLATVAQTGADPTRLTLEITEGLFVDNVMDIVEKMKALRRYGISFALDDFGTGYSSMAYLKQMPLQELKIDRTFVRDVLTDANDATIARAVIALGHELGFEVVAEGVETEAQFEFLVSSGCPFHQGYLFSPPVVVEQFEHLLRDGAGTCGVEPAPCHSTDPEMAET
jgi:diguanylate cyclase (GGDEF)-like protein/PAS domain S-box-containing protein